MSTAFQDVGEARRAHQVTEARRSGRHTELLRRVCHELLSSGDLSSVLHAVLHHVGEHVDSEIVYLRVIDHEAPTAAIESVRGVEGRELDALIAWLDQRPNAARTRSRAAATRSRTAFNLDRFAIGGQPGIEGVLVLDCRASLGPAAFDDHSVMVAVAGLIADAIRSRRDLRSGRADEPRLRSMVVAASVPDPRGEQGEREPTPQPSLKAALLRVERDILIDALHNAAGNHSRAARALQTTPRILAYRLKRHGLHTAARKPGP